MSGFMLNSCLNVLTGHEVLPWTIQISVGDVVVQPWFSIPGVCGSRWEFSEGWSIECCASVLVSLSWSNALLGRLLHM